MWKPDLWERTQYAKSKLKTLTETLSVHSQEQGVTTEHLPDVPPVKLKLTSRYHKYETTRNLLKRCRKCGNLRPQDHFRYKGPRTKSGKQRRGRICVQCRQTKNAINSG